MPRWFHALALTTTLAGCAPAERGEPARPATPPGVVAPAPEALRAMGIQTTAVARTRSAVHLELLGQVLARPEAEAVVHAPLSGHVTAVWAAVGDRVARGAPLVELRSAELGRAQAAYLQALGEHRLAAGEHARQRRLYADALASRRELEEAEQHDATARLKLVQATEDLRVLGLADGALAALARRGRVAPLHVVRAPVAGTVAARHATLGDRVGPDDGQALFELVDLAIVRVEADVPERDMRHVRAGQGVGLTFDALGGRALPGRVARVAPRIDGASRTGRALIDVPNPRGELHPGMSARARIQTGERLVLTVPAAAVQREGERAFVYAVRREGGFREAPLVLGPRIGDAFAVTAGLAQGDEVVVKGAFDLRAEARKASFGGDAP